MKAIHAADLFCGAGGTSAGLLDACHELKRTLRLVAINHWEVAIQTHTRNHPMAEHMCASLDHVNPLEAVERRHLDILVASPECTHHSIARGGRPINDQSRASAWVILKWIQELRIDNVLIENVKEFRDWGPLDYRGRPMKSRKGAVYAQFLNSLKAFGYTVEDNILNCANYGDATTRERLFIMARRGNKKIFWPEPTHSSNGATELFGKRKKWRAAREIIDWNLKGESIYTRKRPLKATTLARIYAGIEKFCGPLIAEAFLRDVTSQFPTTLVKEFLVVLRRNGNARSIDDPVPTLTAGGQHIGMAQFILQQQSGGAPRSVDEPLPTVATKGAIAQACIIPQFSEQGPRSVDAPLGTVTTTSRGIGLAEFICSAGGPKVDPRSVDQPANTVLTRDHMALSEAFLVPFFGERIGQRPRTHSVDPLPAVTSHGAGAVVQPFVAKVNHGNGGDPNGAARRCYPVDQPLGVVTTKNGYAVVQPSLVKYNGTGKANSVDEPLDAVTTKDRFGLVEPKITPDYRVEVLFRMLQPHELAAAHSVEHFKWPDGLRKSDIVKMIGNMVPRRTAGALCRAMLEQK
jgi:DNA (cytosine-5)-methyltransferase 1